MPKKLDSELSKLRLKKSRSRSTSPKKQSPLSYYPRNRNRRSRQQEESFYSRENIPILDGPSRSDNDILPVPPASTSQDEELSISIGIDLGTTYSGVAWSLSTSPNDIVIVSSWETEDIPRSSDLHKVPSVLTYNSSREVTSWGYRIDEFRNVLSWFKLCLSEKATQKLAKDQPERHERLQALLRIFNKEPVDVVADYLHCVWEHVKEDIQEKATDWLWENAKLKIVLTVPAIWDHKAQEMTRQAARKAGILERDSTTLELIGEPEAAALEVFTEMRMQRRGDLKVGDTFIVCDAGGGTVDLISYLIEELKPLKLSMCSESTGEICGAIFVDGAFEKQMRTLISDEEYDKLDRYAKRGMMKNWEYGPKRTFRTGGRKETWNVDIPGFQGAQIPTPGELDEEQEGGPVIDDPTGFVPMANKRLSTLRMNSPYLSQENLRQPTGTVVLRIRDLTAIFSEVCSKIIALVNNQRAVIKSRKGKEPAAILLVGGFGENVYLKQQLQESFGNSGIKIQQPTKAWAAICRGAVLRGHGNDIVINHISKYNYGCSFRPEFVNGKHLEQDRNYDELLGYDVAENQIRWFLNRGESVIKQAPVTHGFFLIVINAKELKHIELTIYCSDSVTPETRIDNGVKAMCKVKVILDESVYEELPSMTSAAGKKWKKLSYVLELEISSGQLCWSVKRDGVNIGNAKMEVTYE